MEIAIEFIALTTAIISLLAATDILKKTSYFELNQDAGQCFQMFSLLKDSDAYNCIQEMG